MFQKKPDMNLTDEIDSIYKKFQKAREVSLTGNSQDCKLSNDNCLALRKIYKNYQDKKHLTIEELAAINKLLKLICHGSCYQCEDILADYYFGIPAHSDDEFIRWAMHWLLIDWQEFNNKNYMKRFFDIMNADEKNPHKDDPEGFIKESTGRLVVETYLKYYPNGEYYQRMKNIYF